MGKRGRWALAVAALAVLAHLPALAASFVMDDYVVVLEDPNLWSWQALPRVLVVPTVHFIGVASVYRPTLSLSWGLDLLTWGRAGGQPLPFPFHLTSLLLHAAVSGLLVLVLEPALGGRGSAVAGALFAVHPATVEDVAWVAARADLVAVLFALLAVLALRLSQPLLRSAAVGAAALLAYGGKEIAVLLPAALLLWLLAVEPERRRQLVAPLAVATVALALFAAAHELVIGGRPSFPLLFADATPFDRFRIALSVIAIYARLLVWPQPLTVEYYWPGEQPPGLLWLPGLLLVAAAAPLLAVRRTREIGGWLLVTLVGLAPVVHLMPFFELVAERYLYVPAIGFCALVAIGHGTVERRSRPLATVLLALVLATWSALSFRQSLVWLDSVTLFENAVAHAPSSPLAHSNLATAYLEEGMVERAVPHWQAALRLGPGNRQARYNLARWHALAGRPQEALALLGRREQWRGDALALALWDAVASGQPPLRSGE
jgi:protein O-mannosyl-transferase